MADKEGKEFTSPVTPKTPYHANNSLNTLMNNRPQTPSIALYSTPRYEVAMTHVGTKPSEYSSQLIQYWKGRINTTNRDLFLPNVANVLGKKVVLDLFDRALSTLRNIHINNLIIDDVNKMTLAVFNSVLSSLMEEEINRGVSEQTTQLLTNHAFTYSILALSFDTAIYLLINNQFDILTQLTTFDITAFDLQRILDRFVDKLNQQSSYLVNGDVRQHYNRIMDNILDYAIWSPSSIIWQYFTSSTQKLSVAVEVFIRHLLYFAYTHLKEVIQHLEITEEQKSFLSSNAWQLMKHVIQQQTFLFKNRSTSCILICCIFGVIKLFRIDMTFVQLLNVYGTLYPSAIHRAKYDIDMKVEEIVTSYDHDRGNIIEFYNNIFVIANNKYLVDIKNHILSCDHSMNLPLFINIEDRKLSTSSLLTSSNDRLTVHDSIIEEAKQTLSSLREEIPKVASKPISQTNSVQEKKDIEKEDKALHHKEEQVKDLLMNLASLSPTRNTQPASPRIINPSTPTLTRPQLSIPSPNIVINFQRRISSLKDISNKRDNSMISHEEESSVKRLK